MLSHPSRVRGLKQLMRLLKEAAEGSHPSRVRGLKLHDAHLYRFRHQSHPSRVRGLKQHLGDAAGWQAVAPLTGAWIETSASGRPCCRVYVAPLTGAWIETSISLCNLLTEKSHPSRVRGLKH